METLQNGAASCDRMHTLLFTMHNQPRMALFSGVSSRGVEQVKATVAGLVTPHLLRVVDIAKQEETGATVDWHVREAVSKTIDELGHLYNARDLLAAYTQGLANAAEEARRERKWYARVLREAATQAARELERRD